VCYLPVQVLIDNLVYSPVFNLLVMAYIATVVQVSGGSLTAAHLTDVAPNVNLLMLSASDDMQGVQ